MLFLVNELMVVECSNLICEGPPMTISDVYLSFYDQLDGNHSNLSWLLKAKKCKAAAQGDSQEEPGVDPRSPRL